MSTTIQSFVGCSLWEMKRRLSQYKDLLREIERDRLRLAQLAGRLARLNPAGLPQGVPITAEAIADYRDRIEQNLVRCVELTRDIQDFINRIDDSELRRVFTMRYINGHTW